MNAIKRNRLLLVLAAMLVLGSVNVEAQTGRLELNVPNFDLFTPTDWIDAATFTLKESIPAGISGTIITSQPMEVFLRGTVYKQASGDPGPLELASFYIVRRTPVVTVSPTGSGEARYEMTVGALSRGSQFDVSYTERKSEVDKLKDQLKTGIASMTGKFTLDVVLMAGDPVTGTQLDRIVRVFDIPFSTATQAKVIVQVDPVVTVPNPTFTILLPAERPQLEYELAVYRVEDNPRDAVQNGSPVWRERVVDGRTILVYPQTATPLVQGARYVAAGRSFIQASSNRDKVAVDADLVVFRYGEATGGSTGGNTGGQDGNRPDPLISAFGNAATQVPPQLAQQLTTVMRRLEDRGWTFTQIRLNNRVISATELAQIMSRFQNANVTVVE